MRQKIKMCERESVSANGVGAEHNSVKVKEYLWLTKLCEVTNLLKIYYATWTKRECGRYGLWAVLLRWLSQTNWWLWIEGGELGFRENSGWGGMPRLNARNIGAKCMRQAVKRKAIGPLKRQLKYAAGREWRGMERSGTYKRTHE